MATKPLLIITQRHRNDGFGRQPGYLAFSEAEDVLAGCTAADLASIEQNPSHAHFRVRRAARRTLRRVAPGDVARIASRRDSRRVLCTELPDDNDRYDVAVFIGYTLWDLALLQHLRGLRKRVGRLIAWFPEMWSSELRDGRIRHEPFDVVDDIFVGMEAAAVGLARIAGRPVFHLPAAVDVDRFGAYHQTGHRSIDVLGIGRRDPALHDALVDWSRRQGATYVFDDTMDFLVADPVAHRTRLAATYRLANVALTNFAKFDLPDVVGGEREIPGRLWEGLSGGAVMVGRPPDRQLERTVVGREVVGGLPTNAVEAVAFIDDLIRRDSSAMRIDNTRLALCRHDWAHRWIELFETAAIPVPAGLTERALRLRVRAGSTGEEPSESLQSLEENVA